MADSSNIYGYSGDYRILWVHPKMPHCDMWKSSHDFDLCLRIIFKAMAGRGSIEVYDLEATARGHRQTPVRKVIHKIVQSQPHLIMFFDGFAQYNVELLHAIRKNKEITKRSFQILSYPTLSLVLSNFSG